jgi:N-sulfoglucosamine sulfohydrolase
MRRRDFLKTVGCGAAALATGGLAQAAPRPSRTKSKPNILWLISESTSPDFACYGNKQVKTPSFDRLAGEGARFTHVFATAPVSSASRSAFMTGMYQTSIGAHNHRSHRGDGYRLPKPVDLIAEYFRQAGYFTCNCDGLSYKKPGKTDWNFMTARPPFDGTDWSQRKAGQPFFAMVNFSLTGRPFERDKRNPIDQYVVDVPECYPDHPIARRDWADYLESIQALDSQVGVALAWLEREDLSGNTIVVYSADNGRPHVRCEQWLYDGGIHVPMMIRWPRHIEGGSVFEGLVSTVDLAPTLLSLAEIPEPMPKHFQGHIFLGPRRQPRKYVFGARDRCDETVDRVRCVRSQGYKYIRNDYPDRPYTQFNGYQKLRYPMLTLLEVLRNRDSLTPQQSLYLAPAKPREEFYDLAHDPLEMTNLAGDSTCKSLVEEHSKKLDEWIQVTADQGQKPEPPAAIAYWRQQAAESYDQTMEDRGLSVDIPDDEYLTWWEKELRRQPKLGVEAE